MAKVKSKLIYIVVFCTTCFIAFYYFNTIRSDLPLIPAGFSTYRQTFMNPIMNALFGRKELIFDNEKYSLNKLEEFRLSILNRQRNVLEGEMENVKPFVDGGVDRLLTEKGGQPVRSVIFATYRSGSTFVGEIVQQQPGTYYHYEPLLDFGIGAIQSIKSRMLAEKAVETLKSLLHCRYDELGDLVQRFKNRVKHHNHNSRLSQYCRENSDVCWDTAFLSSMCELFPYQSMKIIRLQLKYAKILLDDETLNVKIMLLIRDPRAIMQSRIHIDWCKRTKGCTNPTELCPIMVDDYFVAETLYKDYPNRFMTLRYEDISLNPFQATKKMYKFFGLHYSKQIEDFVHNHTVTQDDGNIHPYSTYRNSKQTPFHWKTELANNVTALRVIQTRCFNAMQLWGYVPIMEEEEHHSSFNPLGKPPWDEMNI